MTDTQIARRKIALDMLNSGDPSGAAVVLREMLAVDADNADLLGLLGIALEEAGDKDAGAETLRRALVIPADASIEFRNASNLGVVLFDSGRRQEASELLRRGWRWPEGRAPQARDIACIALLARTMSALRLHEELVALLMPVAQFTQLEWPALLDLAHALATLGRTKESLRLVEESRAPEAGASDRKAMLAYLYWKEGFTESARKARNDYIASAPPYLAPARAGQKRMIGVINPVPPMNRLILSASTQHFETNYPALLLDRFPDRYRLASLFLGSGRKALEQFQSFKPSVVINNVVSAEVLMSDGNLDRVKRLLEAIGAPVINAPEAAAQCTRQMNSLRLARIPNLVVPKVSRFTRDIKRLDELVKAIEDAFDYPMIVRTTNDHNSKNMTLAHARDALREALQQHDEPQIYVIQYLGKPRRDEFYRRIRAAFVSGAPIIMRADYSRDWIVRSRNWIDWQAYRSRPDLYADTNAIIAQAPERLGSAAMAALEAVGRSISLDIFGMDFDIDDEGRVIFFEANASMNLFPMTPPEFPYPPVAEQTLIDHIDRLFERRAGQTERNIYAMS